MILLRSSSDFIFAAQVIFSSLYEQVVAFTKDYSEIRAALTRLEEYNKTCLDSALAGVSKLVIDEWGLSPQCQVRDIVRPLPTVSGIEGYIATIYTII